MLRVLIADDEKVIRQGLSLLVDWESLGFEVVALAENGLQANQIVREHGADVVISDIRMPKMNGLELARLLSEKHETVDFIAISGYRDFEYAQQMMACGAVAYLLKPIDTRQLEDVLRKIAAKRNGSSKTGEHELIPQMRRIIERRFCEELTLQDISAELNYNAAYLGRIFKQETGQLFRDYLNFCRMARAAQLLRESSVKVSQVAEQVGIQDTNYFTKQFRSTFEKTPTQYRNQHAGQWSRV